jgi:hypothetical protein
MKINSDSLIETSPGSGGFICDQCGEPFPPGDKRTNGKDFYGNDTLHGFHFCDSGCLTAFVDRILLLVKMDRDFSDVLWDKLLHSLGKDKPR